MERGESTSCRPQFVYTIVFPRNAPAASWLLARALDLLRELRIAQTTAGVVPRHALRCRHGSQENALFFFSWTFERFNDIRTDGAEWKRGAGERREDAKPECPFYRFGLKPYPCRSVMELVARSVAHDRGLQRVSDASGTTPFWRDGRGSVTHGLGARHLAPA